jgi:uncharacterized RDD family membrane protein YckC
MSGRDEKKSYTFKAHESPRLHALNGLPLARWWQRLLGYAIDFFIAVVIWIPIEFLWRHYVLQEQNIDLKWDFHEKGNLVVMVLYWATANYLGNGRTPGKWVARTRAVSLTSERLGLWQSIERVLGYGAAILEGGLGFAQFFWDKNRMCAQDRLAETIVIDTRPQSS